MPSVTVTNLIKDALMEIGVLAGGEPLSPANGDFGVTRLNQLFDNYNAMREASYVEEFNSFTFIASQQDYTIGPSGADFTLTPIRPDVLDGANVIINTTSPNVRNPINIRDYQWWMNIPVRTVSTTFPTDLYYEPSWPNGIIHFWPVPSSTYGVELINRKSFAQVTITDTLNFPAGYQSALMLTLAEMLAPSYGRTPSPLTMQMAREARARIYQENDFTPRISTQDAGMPANSRNRATFNYRTGLDVNVNR